MQEKRELSESEVIALEKFQNELKRCVQDAFGIYLPYAKVATITKTNYIDYDKIAAARLQTIEDLYAIQGAILRDILDSIIDLTCEKKLEVETNKVISIEYGRNLEDGIIEYYAQRIAALYHLNIDQPKNGINLDLAMVVYNKLKDKLNPNVFQYNAIGLLDLVGDKDLIKKCDELAIDHYYSDDAVLAAIPALQYIEEEEKDKVLEGIKQDKEEEEASAMGLWQEAIEAERETELVTPIEETEENKQPEVKEEPKYESVNITQVVNPIEQVVDKADDAAIPSVQEPVPVVEPQPVVVPEQPVLTPEPSVVEPEPVVVPEPTPVVQQPEPEPALQEIPQTPTIQEEKKIENNQDDSLSDEEKERVDEIIADYASGKKISDEEWKILIKAMPELNKELVNDTNIIEYSEDGGSPTLSFNTKGKGFASKHIMIYLAIVILAVVLVFGFLLFKGLK